MAELFERDGHCEHCGCPIYTDPMMGTHCACPPWEPKPAAPADGHAWTFDPYHQAHRCTQCGIVSYDATPAGPCTCAPSTWLPPGADDAPPRPVISNDGRCSCGSRLYLGASRCYLCSVPPVDHAPKVDASTLDMFDPFDVLRRMGEEARAEPMTADDEAMLVRIKAAVRRKLGEE